MFCTLGHLKERTLGHLKERTTFYLTHFPTALRLRVASPTSRRRSMRSEKYKLGKKKIYIYIFLYAVKWLKNIGHRNQRKSVLAGETP